MVTKKKRSVLPIYLMGLVWLLSGLFFSLHRTIDYILCALISVSAFILGKAIFPDKEFQVATSQPDSPPKETQPPKETLSPEIVALIQERDRAISEMRRLNESIADAKISSQIDHLEEVATNIMNLVVEKPQKLPQIQRFLNYYLPTTLKILNAYDRMGSAGVSGENITATRQKVEGMIDTISLAFDRQLDSLFGEEALDISTDIKVMENLLAQEGLGGLKM